MYPAIFLNCSELVTKKSSNIRKKYFRELSILDLYAKCQTYSVNTYLLAVICAYRVVVVSLFAYFLRRYFIAVFLSFSRQYTTTHFMTQQDTIIAIARLRGCL